jgi:heptosyltransferase I
VKGFVAMRRLLRERRFDLLLCLQISLKAGVLSALSGAPVRLGFDWRRSRDMNFLFTNRRIPARPDQHVQDQYFEFLEELGIEHEPVEWKLGPWPDEAKAAGEILATLDRPAVTLIIATSNPEKDWIPARWAELCDRLFEDFGLQPVLAGGRSERELAIERVIREPPHHCLLRVGRGFSRVGFKSVSGVCECSGESQVQRDRMTNEVFSDGNALPATRSVRMSSVEGCGGKIFGGGSQSNRE